MKNLVLTGICLMVVLLVKSQEVRDKATFKEYKPGYFQNYILKGIDDYQETKEVKEVSKTFKMDITGQTFPKTMKDYKTFWHSKPISQGNTNTCWSFSATSFFESEVYRLYGKQVKISEMFTVYWEYVEKVKRYIEQRGNSAIAEGSEGNAVTRIMKLYGAVPYDVYSGLLPGQKYFNHEALIGEIKSYLETVKSTNAWDEEVIISTVKSIMEHYMGAPPEKFKVGNVEMTPMEYLKNELKLNPDDYVDILSYKQEAFWTKCEYKVPDNWWHDKSYYNVPLEDYMKALKNALKNGYTVAIGGDVSEAGFLATDQVALVPSFDIPVNFIDDNARQFRFSNGTTTDDHGMHIVGYLEKDGVTWFLVKDSGSGSRNVGEGSETFGYYFFREDYVKLKMMDFTVHKDAVKDLLKKF